MSDKVPVSQINQDADNYSCSNCPPVPRRLSADRRIQKLPVDPQNREPCSWFEVQYLVRELASQLKRGIKEFDCILAISTGGLIPAKLLAEELGIYDIKLIPIMDKHVVYADLPKLDRKRSYVVIDDIFDTGHTIKTISEILSGYDHEFAFCMSRYPGHPGIAGRVLNHNRWIVFPWEKGL